MSFKELGNSVAMVTSMSKSSVTVIDLICKKSLKPEYLSGQTLLKHYVERKMKKELEDLKKKKLKEER
jgi:hypothetical protein